MYLFDQSCSGNAGRFYWVQWPHQMGPFCRPPTRPRLPGSTSDQTKLNLECLAASLKEEAA